MVIGVDVQRLEFAVIEVGDTFFRHTVNPSTLRVLKGKHAREDLIFVVIENDLTGLVVVFRLPYVWLSSWPSFEVTVLRKRYFVETELAFKHEGAMLAYKATRNEKDYSPIPPTWVQS